MKTILDSKIRVVFKHILTLLTFTLSHPMVMAFSDIYEPDDSAQQANLILVDDKKPRQHTLHSREDSDWFKFYAHSEVGYEITANPVGSHIDVALKVYDIDGITVRKEANKSFEGKKEFLTFSPSSTGFYYVKVTDSAPESKNCRVNIQYELRIGGTAQTLPGVVSGYVTDAISGKPINEAIIFTSCNKNYPVPSFEEGAYNLPTHTGWCELTAIKEGYKPLTCHIQIPEFVPIQKNLSLLPNQQKVPAPLPSQTVYHHDEILHIEFQTIGLPAQSCIRYYFGIEYPDGDFFVIHEFNRLEPFNTDSLPHWRGSGNVVIDKQIDNDMPLGKYTLYLLRMPEGIDDPIKNMVKGELNVGEFLVK